MGEKGGRRQNVWIHLENWLLGMRTSLSDYAYPSPEVIRQWLEKSGYLELPIIERTTYTINPHPTISPGFAEHLCGPSVSTPWLVSHHQI